MKLNLIFFVLLFVTPIVPKIKLPEACEPVKPCKSGCPCNGLDQENSDGLCVLGTSSILPDVSLPAEPTYVCITSKCANELTTDSLIARCSLLGGDTDIHVPQIQLPKACEPVSPCKSGCPCSGSDQEKSDGLCVLGTSSILPDVSLPADPTYVCITSKCADALTTDFLTASCTALGSRW